MDYGFSIFFFDVMCLFNVCKHTMSVYFAHASGHTAIVTQCIF